MKSMLKPQNIIILLLIIFFSCSRKEYEIIPHGDLTYSDFIGKQYRFAAQLGEVYAEVARDFFKANEVQEYTTIPDILEAIRMNKADVAILKDSYIKQLQDSGMYDYFDYIDVPSDVYIVDEAPIFNTLELRDKYNLWLKQAKETGVWQEVSDRWLGVSLPRQEDIPKFIFTGKNGVLRLADTGNYPPLVYLDANGDLTGFDIEIGNLFAQHLGMTPEYFSMSYDAVIPFVISGKADMSACSYIITQERKSMVLMGDPTIISKIVLIIKREAQPKHSFNISYIFSITSNWIKQGVERNLMTDNRWKLIVNGLSVTMIIAFFAQIFGTIFGGCVCFLLLRKNRFIRLVARLYCRLIYGSPVVMLLMISYYIVFGNVNISVYKITIKDFLGFNGFV